MLSIDQLLLLIPALLAQAFEACLRSRIFVSVLGSPILWPMKLRIRILPQGCQCCVRAASSLSVNISWGFSVLRRMFRLGWLNTNMANFHTA